MKTIVLVLALVALSTTAWAQGLNLAGAAPDPAEYMKAEEEAVAQIANLAFGIEKATLPELRAATEKFCATTSAPEMCWRHLLICAGDDLERPSFYTRGWHSKGMELPYPHFDNEIDSLPIILNDWDTQAIILGCARDMTENWVLQRQAASRTRGILIALNALDIDLTIFKITNVGLVLFICALLVFLVRRRKKTPSS